MTLNKELWRWELKNSSGLCSDVTDHKSLQSRKNVWLWRQCMQMTFFRSLSFMAAGRGWGGGVSSALRRTYSLPSEHHSTVIWLRFLASTHKPSVLDQSSNHQLTRTAAFVRTSLCTLSQRCNLNPIKPNVANVVSSPLRQKESRRVFVPRVL